VNLQDVNVGQYHRGVWEDWPRTTRFVAQLETDVVGFLQVSRFEDGDGFVEFAPIEARGVVGRHGGVWWYVSRVLGVAKVLSSEVVQFLELEREGEGRSD
jgi:hypothetical protein